VVEGKRTTYKNSSIYIDKFFGLLLGVVIAIFFLIFKPTDIFSIQSIISILGAYTIGKELWKDLDSFLIEATAKFSIRWQDRPFYYVRQDFGTIQKFRDLARFKRYQKNFLQPKKIDFISQSNSKALEVLYRRDDLGEDNTSLIAAVNIDKQILEEFYKTDYMIGIKLTLVKNFLFFGKKLELFQALDKTIGTIKNKWIAESVLAKRTTTMGKIKIYLKDELIEDFKIIKSE